MHNEQFNFACKTFNNWTSAQIALIIIVNRFSEKFSHLSGGGKGSGKPEVMGVGSLREVGEERVGDGIPKGAGARRNRNEFCNIAQYFAIEKAHKGGNHYGRG